MRWKSNRSTQNTSNFQKTKAKEMKRVKISPQRQGSVATALDRQEVQDKSYGQVLQQVARLTPLDLDNLPGPDLKL